MKKLLLILLLFPLLALAQKKYKVYHYETHTVYSRGAYILKKYASEFFEQERGFMVKKTTNKNVPESYIKGKVYEDEHGVYMDVVLYDYGSSGSLKNLVTYGTFAILTKDMRTRIEMRDVYYIGEVDGCPSKGTLEEYLNCVGKNDEGRANRIRGHIKGRMIAVSELYKDFLVKLNDRTNDELEIGDKW